MPVWSVDARIYAWLLSMLVATPLLLVFLGRRSNLDGHEVLVAQTAREMIQSGDWIHPRFSGEPRYRKPPLSYWLTGGSYLITGRITEFSARLPTALVTILSIGVLSWFSSRAFDPTTGLLTGLIHATTYWTIHYGKSALVDGVLVALVAGAILLSACDRLPGSRPSRPFLVIGFWILCGLSVLAKGPIGLAIIFPTVLIYRCCRGKRETDQPLFRTWQTLPGPLLFFGLALGWPILVWLEHPEVFSLWYGQSIGRFLEHWGPQTRPWFYYFYYVPLLTLPWTPCWIYELVSSLRNGGNRPQKPIDDLRRLLWTWLAVGVILLSLSQGKREHYILPCLTPLSLLAALGLRRWITMTKNSFSNRQLVLVFGSLCSAILIFETQVTPIFGWRSGALAMFRRNREVFSQTDRIIQFGSGDRWAIFPIDRPMCWPRTKDALRKELSSGSSCLLLVTEDRLPEFIETIPCRVIDRIEQRSYAERDPRQALVLVAPQLSVEGGEMDKFEERQVHGWKEKTVR